MYSICLVVRSVTVITTHYLIMMGFPPTSASNIYFTMIWLKRALLGSTFSGRIWLELSASGLISRYSTCAFNGTLRVFAPCNIQAQHSFYKLYKLLQCHLTALSAASWYTIFVHHWFQPLSLIMLGYLLGFEAAHLFLFLWGRIVFFPFGIFRNRN